MSFKDLKNNSTKSFEKLTKALSEMNQATDYSSKNDDVWSCELDKAGNGYAVIRFLPAPDGEDLPFVRLFSHGFKGPTGKWYIENSLTTIGKPDPVAALNSKLWNSGVESDKEIARKQKRKLNYYANIYVIKDPANPDNEGKCFKFRFGKKIFDKLNDLMNPTFEDEEPIDPFNLWTGANFKLKIRQVDGYANYDKSEFEEPSPLSDDDDELEKIWKQCHSLQALIAPDQFKSYEELEKRLNLVLDLDAPSEVKKVSTADELKERVSDSPKFKEAKPVQKVETEDDDDDMEFFSKLIADDED